ncbi:MAG: Omp28-related outer membrane protein [Bacteroidota bacterium]|nr:Omp28-related outer membrane protein [Bacteroidota bacterium]
MKKYCTIILFILLYISSCDIVETPYMNTENISQIDTNSNNYVKKVLIEDFTGHLCPNCPQAATEIEAIHDIYGEQIIAIAIHVTKSFARPYPASQAPNFQYDFRTSWGDDLDNLFDISSAGLPRGMVNRIGFPDNHKLGKDEWANAVTNELNKEINFGIMINSSNNNINITTQVLNNISGSYNLVVCLTESGIINWQKDGTENIENYEHNHILRSVLLDEALSSNLNYETNQEIQKNITYNLTELEEYNIDYSTNVAELGNGNAGNWNSNNMSIVAYIYNTNTKEVVQVEQNNLNN